MADSPKAGVVGTTRYEADEPKKAEAKEEKKEEKPSRKGLVAQLEDVVEKLESRTSAFSPEEQADMQMLVKRLSRTMGDYRSPNPSD